jgi:hypothetical protein
MASRSAARSTAEPAPPDDEPVELEVTPDEATEIIRETDEALRDGRYVTAEQFCAERGIPWPAPAAG